jgi:hypothetical protein
LNKLLGEEKLNNLLGKGPTTFLRHYKLFTKKNVEEGIKFNYENPMPSGDFEKLLIKYMPFQGDKIVIYSFLVIWPTLTILLYFLGILVVSI